MDHPGDITSEDRRMGPVSVVFCAEGQRSYPARLAQVGFRVTIRRGSWTTHYELSGVDETGRLVYHLASAGTTQPCPAPLA